MTNTTQFQYPDGSDEEVLRTLAQKLAETLPREDYSMSQYLNPEDCLESERYWRPMSRTIEDFRERGSVITKIDADIDTPVLSTDGKAYLNFRAVIHFRNSRDGSETTIFRQFGAIAVFIGVPLFQIDGIDSDKKCGYYVRFDKQPQQWKVSMIQMAPTFDMTPPIPLGRW
jgi:hypothetical protein